MILYEAKRMHGIKLRLSSQNRTNSKAVRVRTSQAKKQA